MNLTDAMEAADRRKTAAGIETPGGAVLAYSDGEETDRAIFSGFDIDYDELVEVVQVVSLFFMRASVQSGLMPLFGAAWCDGLLIGLLLAEGNKCADG